MLFKFWSSEKGVGAKLGGLGGLDAVFSVKQKFLKNELIIFDFKKYYLKSFWLAGGDAGFVRQGFGLF